MISFFYEDCEKEGFIDEKKLLKTTQLFDNEGFDTGELSVIFCSDSYLLSINFISPVFDLSYKYIRCLGVKILFFIKIFFDNSLSIAIADGITPECV